MNIGIMFDIMGVLAAIPNVVIQVQAGNTNAVCGWVAAIVWALVSLTKDLYIVSITKE